jgi:GDP-mannose 6-dehydrogenase
MKISVLGLGYVGCVSAACFAKRGHEVLGADVNQVKVDIITNGKSPIVEPGIEEFISEAVKAGNLRATTDAPAAVLATDVSCASALQDNTTAAST